MYCTRISMPILFIVFFYSFKKSYVAKLFIIVYNLIPLFEKNLSPNSSSWKPNSPTFFFFFDGHLYFLKHLCWAPIIFPTGRKTLNPYLIFFLQRFSVQILKLLFSLFWMAFYSLCLFHLSFGYCFENRVHNLEIIMMYVEPVIFQLILFIKGLLGLKGREHSRFIYIHCSLNESLFLWLWLSLNVPYYFSISFCILIVFCFFSTLFDLHCINFSFSNLSTWY